VIANLAVYFAIHTLFADTIATHWGAVHLDLPDVATQRPVAAALAVLAALLLFGATWSVLRTLGVCAVLGLAAGLSGIPLT
jgi:chromate transporter